MLSPHTVLLLGIWLIVVRYLGVPGAWRSWLYVLTGVALLVVYARGAGQSSLRRFLETKKTDTFTQNSPVNVTSPSDGSIR